MSQHLRTYVSQHLRTYVRAATPDQPYGVTQHPTGAGAR